MQFKISSFFTRRSNEEEKEQKQSSAGKVLNRKRTSSSVQLHLELGQRDFLLRTCRTCGFCYSPGDEEDEKVHASFHKTHTDGISFKGWCRERVIHVPHAREGRIVLVLDSDSRAQRRKAEGVARMMEAQLGGGSGWILNRHCKVYLFVLSQRIAGCAVAEPINAAAVAAHSRICSGETRPQEDAQLKFGGITFRRETMKRRRCVDRSTSFFVADSQPPPLPVVCGVRAIWVSPSNRRRRIATHLLDGVRQSFSERDGELHTSQLAFSEPTSSGIEFLSAYTSSARSFLIYKHPDASAW